MEPIKISTNISISSPNLLECPEHLEELDANLVLTLLLKWGIKPCKIEHMVGYEVINYLVKYEEAKYVAKINVGVTMEELQILKNENDVLIYLHSFGETHRYPEPVQSQSNELIYLFKTLRSNEPILACMRVFKYMEGNLIGDIFKANNKKAIDECIKESVIFIAKSLTLPLIKFTEANVEGTLMHSLKNRSFKWHMGSFLEFYYAPRIKAMKESTIYNDFQTSLIDNFVNLYSETLSKLTKSSLRKSFIHNDLNEYNILWPVGVIDFGDLVYTYLCEDIAIFTVYCAYYFCEKKTVADTIVTIIKIYTEIVPITEEELKLIFITIPARICLSLCNSSYALFSSPNDKYIASSQVNGWGFLTILMELYNGCHEIFETEFYKELMKNTNFSEIEKSEIPSIWKEGEIQEIHEEWIEEDEFWDDTDENLTEEEQEHILQIVSEFFPQICPNVTKLTKLEGYITKNYLIKTPEGKSVLKIYKETKNLESVINLQSQVLLAFNSSNLQVPQPLIPHITHGLKYEQSSLETNAIYTIVEKDKLWNVQAIYRTLTYVEGHSFSTHLSEVLKTSNVENEWNEETKTKLTNLYNSLGKFLSNLIMKTTMYYPILSKNNKESIQRLNRKDNPWCIQNIEMWVKEINTIENENTRKNVEWFVERAGSWKELRRGLIHGDANEDNVIVYNGEVTGIIDFDEIQVTYLVNDIITTMAHCFHPIPKLIPSSTSIHPLFKLCLQSLLSSYSQYFSLTDVEIESIFILLGLRISLVICMTSKNILVDPNNVHISFDYEILQKELGELRTIGNEEFSRVMKEAVYKAKN